MSLIVFFSFSLVLVFSLIIAANERYKNRDKGVTAFLFSGNDTWLAISSNVGSLLSISIIFSLFCVGIIGFGVATLISTIIGISAAYLTLYLCRKSIGEKLKTKAGHTTLVDISEPKGRGLLTGFILAQYCLAITLEFAVLYNFLKGLESEIPYISSYLSVFVFSLCALYTLVGGYSGILKTDLFQILIFFVGAIIAIFSLGSPIDFASGFSDNFNAITYRPKLAGPVTWALFTYAVFLAFPDVWIRIFGSLKYKDYSSKKLYCGSLFLLLLALIPILAIASDAAPINGFSETYDVAGCYEHFIGEFLTFNASGTVKLILCTSFIAIFITTIDTWLMGSIQHIHSALPKLSMPHFVGFVVVLGGVTLITSSQMPANIVFLTGLHLFPFIFMNATVFLSFVFNYKSNRGVTINAVKSTIAGLATTQLCINLFGPLSSELAPHIISISMCIQLLTFFAFSNLSNKRNFE